MIAHLQNGEYAVSQTRIARRFQFLVFTIFLSWFVSAASAQFFWDYYEQDTYHPLVPYKAGTLGTLFNSAPLLIKQATTTYNDKQDVYVLAYLPFVEQEYSIFANNSLELFGPNYKTAVALASPRDPALGLYARVQVSAMDSSLTEPNTVARYPFASIIPYGTDPNSFTGPFNTLATANTYDPAFIHPTPGEYGVSVLAAAQKFTKFSHELLTDKDGVGWDGFDKEGENTMKFVIVQSNIPGYERTKMIPNSGGVIEIVLNKLPSAQISTGQMIIGHEIAHGIVHHAIGTEMVLFKSQSFQELDEGFCLIIGHSFRLWMRPEQFSVPDWEYWRETIPVGSKGYLIDKPKLNGLPNTYQGAYYDYSPGHPSYDVHDNGAVMGFWFYLLNSTTSGYVDDKESNAEYYVQPLIPGDKEGTYKLALRILFNAFTTKLNHKADYPELRQATLETAKELGYNSSSHVYKQLMSAWSAVGVENPEYNASCASASAESLHNGLVSINTRESTLTPDPGSEKISKLLDCSGPDTIATLYNSNRKAYLADDNGDHIYSETDNQFESKIAVSVHKFSQISRDWYKTKLGWDGMDGSGQFRINNVMGGNSGASSIMIYGTHSASFFYPYKALSACRDEISRVYFNAVADFVKFSAIPDKPYQSEWEIVIASVGQIFSLETKKDYERAIQNPDAEQIWTIFEDSEDQSLLRSFENPKLNGQPALYNGANWSNASPEHNSGFINLF